MRTKKLTVLLMVIPLIIPLLFGLFTNSVLAWFNTPVQTRTLYMDNNPVGKVGTTTQYGYDEPATDPFPHFYSALIASCPRDAVLFCLWYPKHLKIEVSGTDPNGNTLSGDRFGDLEVLLSPDDSGVQQQILKIVYDVVVSVPPLWPLEEIVKNTVSAGGATTKIDATKAWGEWELGFFEAWRTEKGLRFRYALVVDPTLKGTYTINIHYHATIFGLKVSNWEVAYTVSMDLYDTIRYVFGSRPNTPSTPSGPTTVRRNVWYTYSTSTTDPDGDDVYYHFELTGPGTNVLFPTGWYASGETGSIIIMGEPSDPLGAYQIRVRAQDVHGVWSDWSPSLTVNLVPGLTVLAEQNGSSLTTGDVYIDGQWRGLTGQTFTVEPGIHTVRTNDFWDAGTLGYRYGFQHWEDDSTENPRTITVGEDRTIKAYFNKKWCPGDCNGDGYVNVWDSGIMSGAWLSSRGNDNWDSQADLNADGYVNVWDLGILSGNWLEDYT